MIKEVAWRGKGSGGGGVQGLRFRGVGGRGRASWVGTHHTWLGGRGVREAGQGLGGGARASVPGGLGGRDTGPRDGANFAPFLTRTKSFFEGCPVGWGGGYPSGLVDGGVDQGP